MAQSIHVIHQQMKRIVRSSLLWRGLQALYSPGRVISKLVEITPFVPFSLMCALDAFPRPHYAYGVVQAARLAQKLDIKEIAVIEFGVGRGEGLIFSLRPKSSHVVLLTPTLEDFQQLTVRRRLIKCILVREPSRQ